MADESTISQNPAATEFVRNLNSTAWRKAKLGDPDTYSPKPYNYPMQAREAIEQGIRKVTALASDRTRTLVQKHDAARQIVNAVCGTLERCRVGIERDAHALAEEFDTNVSERLDVEKIGSKTYSLIVDWVRREAEADGGVDRIRKRVETDRDVASVVFQSKGFLLGLSDDASARLTELAYTKHAADALPKYERAQKLAGWAANYTQVQRSLHASLYNTALADQVSTRVEV